jgi:ABC transporter substrate binding protein
MRRRDFINAVAGAATVLPLSVRAQQAGKLPTIGFLGSDLSAFSPWANAFVARLRELGWIENRTIAIEYRWSEGRTERYAEIADEFVRLKVDVIVTVGSAVPTVRQATTVIPIVFAVAIDPVGTGLVASLAKPGGNVTGLSLQAANLAGKRLELLREVVPQLRRLAIIFNAGNAQPVLEMEETQTAARAPLVSTSHCLKSDVRRISLLPLMQRRARLRHFTWQSINCWSPTCHASSPSRLVPDYRRSSVRAILSRLGASCPMDQTIRICSGAQRTMWIKFCMGPSQLRYRLSSQRSLHLSSISRPQKRLA